MDTEFFFDAMEAVGLPVIVFDEEIEWPWFQFHMSYSHPMVHNGIGGFYSYVVLPYGTWEEYPKGYDPC